MSQIHASQRKSRGLRWTNEDKALALSLLHSSPKTFRLLRKVFSLPSVKTLRKIMQNIDVYPGFNRHILTALQHKVSKMPESAKFVCLALDEMALKEGLTYDPNRDEVEGLSEGKIVNHALVFMARGIIHRWKQPFGYFLSSGPVPGQQLKSLLFEAIQELEKTGLKVIVVVSDQGSNNISVFQTQLHVTVEQPFFMVGKNKVFVIYDPPHLMKNIRNNLKRHGFSVNGHSVKWDHIVEFHARDSSKPVRLAPKVTLKHVKLPPFSNLRVCLATQILSHSVATGIKIMVQWGILDEEAGHTAEFIENFDQLFNCFNSSSLTSPALMRHALSETSGHVDFLKAKFAWIQSIKSGGMYQKFRTCFNNMSSFQSEEAGDEKVQLLVTILN